MKIKILPLVKVAHIVNKLVKSLQQIQHQHQLVYLHTKKVTKECQYYSTSLKIVYKNSYHLEIKYITILHHTYKTNQNHQLTPYCNLN